MRGLELGGGNHLGGVRQPVQVGAAVEALQVVTQLAEKYTISILDFENLFLDFLFNFSPFPLFTRWVTFSG